MEAVKRAAFSGDGLRAHVDVCFFSFFLFLFLLCRCGLWNSQTGGVR